jgi:heat shock protein HslJ
VESLNGELVELPANSPEVYIMFKTDKPGQLAGNNGCNTFFGGYEIMGDTLILSDVMQTLKACQDPFAELETQFMEVVYAVDSYAGDYEKLYFFSKGDTIAVFRQ